MQAAQERSLTGGAALCLVVMLRGAEVCIYGNYAPFTNYQQSPLT